MPTGANSPKDRSATIIETAAQGHERLRNANPATYSAKAPKPTKAPYSCHPHGRAPPEALEVLFRLFSPGHVELRGLFSHPLFLLKSESFNIFVELYSTASVFLGKLEMNSYWGIDFTALKRNVATTMSEARPRGAASSWR